LILGFAGVALPTLFWTLSKRPSEGYDPNFMLYSVVLYPGLLGAGIGLIFWLLARPDKQAAAAPQSN
jgi:drug/metabolite transporter (DMT)-like permease